MEQSCVCAPVPALSKTTTGLFFHSCLSDSWPHPDISIEFTVCIKTSYFSIAAWGCSSINTERCSTACECISVGSLFSSKYLFVYDSEKLAAFYWEYTPPDLEDNVNETGMSCNCGHFLNILHHDCVVCDWEMKRTEIRYVMGFELFGSRWSRVLLCADVLPLSCDEITPSQWSSALALPASRRQLGEQTTRRRVN